MKKAITAVLAMAALAALVGCDSSSPAASPSPQAWHQIDSSRRQAWRLTREGVVLQRAGTGATTTVVLPGWLWVDAPHCPPDLALGPNGEAVITSNVVSTLWKVDPETLAVSVHALALSADGDKDVGFSGLFYSREHGAFFAVSDLQRSLWRIDARLTSAEKIGTSPDWKANFRLAQRLAHGRGPACADLS